MPFSIMAKIVSCKASTLFVSEETSPVKAGVGLSCVGGALRVVLGCVCRVSKRVFTMLLYVALLLDVFCPSWVACCCCSISSLISSFNCRWASLKGRGGSELYAILIISKFVWYLMQSFDDAECWPRQFEHFRWLTCPLPGQADFS